MWLSKQLIARPFTLICSHYRLRSSLKAFHNIFGKRGCRELWGGDKAWLAVSSSWSQRCRIGVELEALYSRKELMVVSCTGIGWLFFFVKSTYLLPCPERNCSHGCTRNIEQPLYLLEKRKTPVVFPQTESKVYLLHTFFHWLSQVLNRADSCYLVELCVRACVCICTHEKGQKAPLFGFPVISCLLTIWTVSHTARSVLLKDTSQLFNALGMNSDHCINF